MPGTLIEFKDNGQDFLVWSVDEAGVVQRSEPFQTDIWRGLEVKNLKILKAGGVVEYFHHGRHAVISHLVKAVHPLVPVEASVLQDSFGYATNTIRGCRATCSYSQRVAIERLAEKLFPHQGTTIVQIPCTPVGKLQSKWRIAPEVK